MLNYAAKFLHLYFILFLIIDLSTTGMPNILILVVTNSRYHTDFTFAQLSLPIL